MSQKNEELVQYYEFVNGKLVQTLESKENQLLVPQSLIAKLLLSTDLNWLASIEQQLDLVQSDSTLVNIGTEINGNYYVDTKPLIFDFECQSDLPLTLYAHNVQIKQEE